MVCELRKDDGVARCFTQVLLAPVLVTVLSSPEIGSEGAPVVSLFLRIRRRIVGWIVDEEGQEGVDECRLATAVVADEYGRFSFFELERIWDIRGEGAPVHDLEADKVEAFLPKGLRSEQRCRVNRWFLIHERTPFVLSCR